MPSMSSSTTDSMADRENKNVLREAGISEDDIDMIDAYYEDMGHTHAWHVTAAFVLAGIEPPFSAAYTSGHQKIIQAHYYKYDTHDSSAQNDEIDAELVGL